MAIPPLWVVALVCLLGFAGLYLMARLTTRQPPVRPGPATPELGEEPPAVVSVLANRFEDTEDAVESTLLDLAARRLLELRQSGDDPRNTTIHLLDSAPEPDLTRYERRVLDRVRGLAVDGVLPVTALTFRSPRAARSWNHQFWREVLDDTRARGLCRSRFGPGLVTALQVLAVLSAIALFAAVLQMLSQTEEGLDGALGGAVFAAGGAYVWLAKVARGPQRRRFTPAGEQVAAAWLGVGRWLRGHEEFAKLPPAAVMVWDRYLAYGAALGVTRVASAVLDLGMGSRNRVWSSHGGRWRRVRVRYPRLWSRYGRTAPRLVAGALGSLALGAILVRYRGVAAELDPAGGGLASLPGELFGAPGTDVVSTVAAVVGALILPVGVALLARGGYRLVRIVADLATVRAITGQVLWQEAWRREKSRVLSYYLAVDDGSADRTTAWALPAELGSRCRAGDTVTIRVRPWSRRVMALSVAERHQLSLQEEAVPVPAAAPAGHAESGPPATGAGTLLSEAEVGQALGMPVRREQASLNVPFGFSMATFKGGSRGRDVLMVMVGQGRLGNWSLRTAARGDPLPEVGHDAYRRGDQAVVRVGEVTVVLTLVGEARGRVAGLPALLRHAADRLVGTPPPAPPVVGSTVA